MGEKFEVRLMEILEERADIAMSLQPWEAIECVRQMLREFDAVIYQP
jgi:hypothetical protein